MGDIAEMMLDGTLCTVCGEFIGSDAGYPVACLGCRRTSDHTAKGPAQQPPDPNSNRTKRRRAKGLLP